MFVRNLILALALFLPSISMAEGDSICTSKTKASDYIPQPLGLEVGGGGMFMITLIMNLVFCLIRTFRACLPFLQVLELALRWVGLLQRDSTMAYPSVWT